MARRVALVSLLVADYDEAIAFYVGKLGFDLVEDTDMGGGKRWVVVSPGTDGTNFLLARAMGDQAEAIGRQGDGRIWLIPQTEDFADESAHMSADGLKFLEEPRHEAYGTVAVFED